MNIKVFEDCRAWHLLAIELSFHFTCSLYTTQELTAGLILVELAFYTVFYFVLHSCNVSQMSSLKQKNPELTDLIK